MIDYAIAEISLGKMLVAESAKGICALLLADDKQQLLNELQRIFSTQQIQENPQKLVHSIAAIQQQVATGEIAKLTLDIQGTVFQREVWQALQHIPCGETWTYSQLADYLHRPKAVRAVASACAKNRIAVLIPCHRVVGKSGALTGYRWGITRKQWLLQQEQKLLAK